VHFHLSSKSTSLTGAAANGLENMPVQARGLYSGILQQGYAMGYLLAAVVNLTLVPDKNDWRPLFQLGAGLSLGAAIFRAVLCVVPRERLTRRISRL
jgi:hypothetical protein